MALYLYQAAYTAESVVAQIKARHPRTKVSADLPGAPFVAGSRFRNPACARIPTTRPRRSAALPPA